MTASIPSPSCAPTRSTRPGTGSAAVRGWARAMGRLDASRPSAAYLDSANRNRLDGAPLEQHVRRPADARAPRSRGGSAGASAHRRGRASRRRISAPATPAFSAAPTRTASRRLTAFAGEWRARVERRPSPPTSPPPRQLQRLRRRDHLPRRAAASGRPAASASTPPMARASPSRPSTISTASSPARFVGNPALTPEAFARLGGRAAMARTAHFSSGHLVLGPAAATRSSTCSIPRPSCRAPPMPSGTSRRDGHRAQRRLAAGGRAELRGQLHLARCRGAAASPARAWLREVRRPRHSFNLAAYGDAGRARAGARASLMSASGGTRISTSSRRADGDARRLCPRLGQSRLSDPAGSSKPMRGPRMPSTPIIRTWSATTRRDGRSMRAFASLSAISLALAAARARARRRGGWRR